MTTTYRNLHSEVFKLLMKSKGGDTQEERVLPRNEAICLLKQQLNFDLFDLISNYKGYLSLDGLIDEAEEVFGKVMENDEDYPPIGREELL